MGIKRLFLASLLTLSLGMPSSLFAARPLFTEETDTVEKGSFELDLGFDYLREGNRDKDYFPSVQLKYAPLEKMEVGGTIGYLWRDVHGGGTLEGWTDLFAHLKYRLWEEGDYYPALALKPMLKLPTRTWRKNAESRRVDYALGAVFDKSFGKGTIFFDMSYSWIRDPGEDDVIHTGMAAEYRFTEGWSAVGEVRYSDNCNSERMDDPLFLNFGLKKKVGRTILDAAVNVGLNNAAPDYGFTIGVTIPFR